MTAYSQNSGFMSDSPVISEPWRTLFVSEKSDTTKIWRTLAWIFSGHGLWWTFPSKVRQSWPDQHFACARPAHWTRLERRRRRRRRRKEDKWRRQAELSCSPGGRGHLHDNWRCLADNRHTFGPGKQNLPPPPSHRHRPHTITAADTLTHVSQRERERERPRGEKLQPGWDI